MRKNNERRGKGWRRKRTNIRLSLFIGAVDAIQPVRPLIKLPNRASRTLDAHGETRRFIDDDGELRLPQAAARGEDTTRQDRVGQRRKV